MMRFLCAMMLILLSSFVANANGGWISSGGEVFEFSKNPWFLRNTPSAHYCVVVDATSVSVSVQTVQAAIQSAFAYWKGELKNQTGPTQGFADLATQQFILDGTCTPSTDIQFLIGYGSLTPDEVAFLQDTQKYVGVTVRTDYDEPSLHAHGFVYISSDFGPHMYHNTGALIAANAWQNQQLLQYALIHETGHIMGLPHVGIGIMSEVFLEQLLNTRFAPFYTSNPIQSFLNPPLTFEVCGDNGSFNASFFQVNPATQCLRFEGTRTNTQFQWNVFSRVKAGAPAVLAGTMKGNLSLTNILGAKPAIVVQLPAGQNVFSLQDRGLNSFMLGPTYVEGSVSAAFVAVGSPRPYDINIELHTDSMSAVGTVNQKQTSVLVYSPPTLLKMLYPINVGTSTNIGSKVQ